jgi:hypothetical protein
MAKLVLTDVVVTLAGTAISDHVASVTLTTDVAEVPTTAFGDTAVTRAGGLKDNSIQLELHQDFAVSPSNSVEALVYPLIGTVAAMTVKPTSGAISTSNPEYQFNVLITSWSPIAGAVGDLATVSVTWPISGAITKDVTP